MSLILSCGRKQKYTGHKCGKRILSSISLILTTNYTSTSYVLWFYNDAEKITSPSKPIKVSQYACKIANPASSSHQKCLSSETNSSYSENLCKSFMKTIQSNPRYMPICLCQKNYQSQTRKLLANVRTLETC